MASESRRSPEQSLRRFMQLKGVTSRTILVRRCFMMAGCAGEFSTLAASRPARWLLYVCEEIRYGQEDLPHEVLKRLAKTAAVAVDALITGRNGNGSASVTNATTTDHSTAEKSHEDF